MQILLLQLSFLLILYLLPMILILLHLIFEDLVLPVDYHFHLFLYLSYLVLFGLFLQADLVEQV